MFRAPFLASVAVVSLFSAPLAAQNATAQTQRQAIFQQMLNDPANRQLMSEYARLSVQLRDFEAAVATLERLVDLEPTNSAARVELAIAYFALGSYAVAEFHLVAAEASGVLSPDQVAQVARYREESVDRDDASDYSGRIEAGYLWTGATGEGGALVEGSIDWRYDLGDAHATLWVTELAFAAFEGAESDADIRPPSRRSLLLRTGPEFRLARDAYGPRLQPYVELGFYDDDPEFADIDPNFDTSYTSWAIGAAYINPISEQFTVYSDLSFGQELSDSGLRDFDFYEFDLGVTYRPSRDTRVRVTATWDERTQINFPVDQVTTALAYRASAQHAFDPAFQNLPNRWVVGGFAQIANRELVAPTFRVNREEESYGLWLRAFVFEDIYIETSATSLTETITNNLGSNPRTREDILYTVQIGWEF